MDSVLKQWSAVIVAVSMIGQSVAFAADPVTFAGLSPMGQSILEKVKAKAAARYEGFSLERKIRFAIRTEKQLLRARKRLLRMSDVRFENLQRRALKFVQNHTSVQQQDSLDLLNGDENELLNDVKEITQQLAPTEVSNQKPVTRTEALASNLAALNDIRTEKNSLINHGVSVIPPSKIAGIFLIAIAVGVIIAASFLVATAVNVIFGSIMIAFGVALIIAAIISIYVKQSAMVYDTRQLQFS